METANLTEPQHDKDLECESLKYDITGFFKPMYDFYFRCERCGCVLNRKSKHVEFGIEEDPFCDSCVEQEFNEINVHYRVQ